MKKRPAPRNLDELQRLLALKRHERPPQPFFARLADNVLHNLDAPERPETMSWLQRVGVHFDLSPAVVGAVGVLLAVLLVAGIVGAMYLDPPIGSTNPFTTDPNGTPIGVTPQPTSPQRGPKPTETPKSTEPVITPDSSLPEVERAASTAPALEH